VRGRAHGAAALLRVRRLEEFLGTEGALLEAEDGGPIDFFPFRFAAGRREALELFAVLLLGAGFLGTCFLGHGPSFGLVPTHHSIIAKKQPFVNAKGPVYKLILNKKKRPHRE